MVDIPCDGILDQLSRQIEKDAPTVFSQACRNITKKGKSLLLLSAK